MNVLSWFDNIKLPVKMSIIGLLAVIGLAIMSYYYTQLSLGKQLTDETELLGLKPASSSVMLKKLLAEHRGLSAQLFGGDESVASALNSKAIEIDQQLSKIRSDIKEAANSSSLLDELDDINDTWKQVRSQVIERKYTKETSFTEHSALISKNDGLHPHILKYFLLSYDSSAATYHTIIASFENVPQLANALGKVRGSTSGILASGQISETEISIIRDYLNTAKVSVRDLDYNMSSASEEEPRFEKMHTKVTELSNKINELTRLTEREVLSAGETTYSSVLYFEQYSQVIDELFELHLLGVDAVRKAIQERIVRTSTERNTTLAVIVLLFLIGTSIGYIIIRSVIASARSLIKSFQKISDGNYDIDFNIERKDEMGAIEQELAVLTQKLRDAAVFAVEASKVKQALDSSSTCFMILNSDREITYMNEAVSRLMQNSSSDITKDIPQFNAASLMGTRIDIFQPNSVHKVALLEQLKGPHKMRLDLGDKSFKLNFTTIKGEDGKDLGNSVEWKDMTEVYEEERRVARILEALDSSSTNIMIADANRDVIYMNRSQIKMMREAESDIREALPHFEADKIIGNSIDRFHKNPSHQRGILEHLTQVHVAEITVGKRHFRLTANTILSNENEHIGTVVEWLDRTKEINAEKEIAQMVTASVAGDFTRRIKEDDKEGFLLTMSQGLNQLVKTTESGLDELSNVLLAISKGDLTKRISSHYEGTFNDLKEYANTTSSNLAEVITQIREASETINNASSEIAQGNSDLSTRTEQQASSLEETASSMEQLTSTVRLNSENANQANGLASQATQVAGKGGELIQEVVATMATIDKSSRKISDIISVIDGIAFQTNILALNAAVEAARAGEQGRGFAVVASEVRTLAQRSANAAKDIKDLIADSVSNVESGNRLVSQSGETMKEIVVSIQHVNDIMNEIAAASAEQTSGIDEVGKAILHMDEMTQQNAALVEEAAAAAESMNAQAVDLIGRVGSFKLSEDDVQTQVTKALHHRSGSRTQSQNKDPLSKQFDELPSVMSPEESRQASRNVIPEESDDDEWESF